MVGVFFMRKSSLKIFYSQQNVLYLYYQIKTNKMKIEKESFREPLKKSDNTEKILSGREKRRALRKLSRSIKNGKL